ncbi:hypothetical protein AMATHDRAFT_146972 [Amanita thiersii Skay4041]|uniref:C2H2-type domain-containing protein n=1 Tax=Amanita thiersii Skay4041 TaxID=703135 RepID=A0A2A9NK89_9AGAR|nr:hypothetical protein AMATHDRAFT_146972 [Amanita thiersii Skay4041]
MSESHSEPIPEQHSETNVNDQENEAWDDADDYDDDDDIDAEAEEIARRLGAELWADIRKAKAEGLSSILPASSATAVLHSGTHAPSSTDAATQPTGPSQNVKLAQILSTVNNILLFVENDELARSILATAKVTRTSSRTILESLQEIVSSGSVSQSMAMSLSLTLVGLAKSETLFGPLRLSNASEIQHDKGKRKRDENDGSHFRQTESRPFKRPYLPEIDLQSRIEEAVGMIAQTLGNPGGPLDPALISSIRLQLHQVFLFAVTSSAGGGREMHALQEISGLIQVIGVLSGILIGQTPDTFSGQHPQTYPTSSTYQWLPNQPQHAATDIGTAVYPCLVAGCKKTFSRLYSLRGHQRLHAVHRPFRCNFCPASFARNHDLKRHVKLHGNKAWKCGGCLKVFSRRDAIKRHKNGSKARGPKSEACIDAEVLEVELDGEEGEDALREERRAKIWSGITVSQANAAADLVMNGSLRDDAEEGEISSPLITGIQSTVLRLHGLLQAHVSNTLGTPVGPMSTLVDPTGGQATLASVIARAQSQALPQNLLSGVVGVGSSSNLPSSVQMAGQPETTSLELRTKEGDGKEQNATVLPPLSMYGLSDEQTRLLEQAIANAASAAQAQAEAEAALEEEEDYDHEGEDYEGSDGHLDDVEVLE